VAPAVGTPAPAIPPTAAPSSAGRPTDWTEQVSIFQPHQAAFWLFSVLLLIGGASFVNEQVAFANASTTAWLVGIVLLAIYAVPVYLLVNAVDLFEREPRSLLIGALLWGAIIATYLAGHINDEWASILQKVFGAEFTRQWGAALVGPGVEELVKFLGVVVIYLIARSEFDDVLDGFVYGAMVGLGFTVAEDMYYFFAHFVGQAGASDLGGLFDGFFTRIIVGGPYSHVLLTGLTGMGLAWFVTRPDIPRSRRILAAALLYAAGVAAHFVWNSPLLDGILGDNPGPTDWILWAAIKGLPFLILLGLVVRLAMRRERRWVREALAEDVAAGVLTSEEVDTIESLRARRAARKTVGARLGLAGERLVARLQHAQIALAIASTGTEPDRAARVAAARELIAGLRTQLAALPTAGGHATSNRLAAGTGAASGAGAVSASQLEAPQAASMLFAPTHSAPAQGLASWQIPDPAGPQTLLAGNLDLEIVARVADWAQVRASNGWTGWVDGRRLVSKAPPPD
jgi:RsiW-degrading membrane proteinase PrsW (M82 family)